MGDDVKTIVINDDQKSFMQETVVVLVKITLEALKEFKNKHKDFPDYLFIDGVLKNYVANVIHIGLPKEDISIFEKELNFFLNELQEFFNNIIFNFKTKKKPINEVH